MKKTLASILAEIDKLEGAAEKIRSQEVAEVVGRIRVAIEHYGLTAADLGFGPGSQRRKAQIPAKGKTSKGATSIGVAMYRDPASGTTWTGRGEPPGWIAGVADREAFRIGSGTTAATEQAKSSDGRSAKTTKQQ